MKMSVQRNPDENPDRVPFSLITDYADLRLLELS